MSDKTSLTSSPVSFTAHFTLPNTITSSFPFILSTDCVITETTGMDG